MFFAIADTHSEAFSYFSLRDENYFTFNASDDDDDGDLRFVSHSHSLAYEKLFSFSSFLMSGSFRAIKEREKLNR